MNRRLFCLCISATLTFSLASCFTGGETRRLELPAERDVDDIVEHVGYTASYNHETLTPYWVAYELTAEELNGTFKPKSSFQWDPDLTGAQAWREDYAYTGWDRGHMAPKSDMKWSEQAYSESFYFSNICPQYHEFNDGAWKVTENFAKRMASQYGSVYIVCGPIYDENRFGTIGEHRVAIPDRFFKALMICRDGKYSAIAMLMDNVPNRQVLKECTMTVDEVERISGLDLFSALPDKIEKAVESVIDWSVWGI